MRHSLHGNRMEIAWKSMHMHCTCTCVDPLLPAMSGDCGSVAPAQPTPVLNSHHYTPSYRAVDSKPDIAMDAVMQLLDRLSPEQQHECLQLLSSRGLSQKQF